MGTSEWIWLIECVFGYLKLDIYDKNNVQIYLR